MALSLQQVSHPLIQSEALEARLHDKVAVLENFVADVPVNYPIIGTALDESIRQLHVAIDHVRYTRLRLLIQVAQTLQCSIQQHGSFPAIDEIDSSDVEPWKPDFQFMRAVGS